MKTSTRPPCLAVMAALWLTGCGESSSWSLPLDVVGTGPFVNATVQVMNGNDGARPPQVFRGASFDDVHAYPVDLYIPNDDTSGPFAYVTVVQDSCIRGAGSRNFIPEQVVDLKQKVAGGERLRILVNRFDDCAMSAAAFSPR